MPEDFVKFARLGQPRAISGGRAGMVQAARDYHDQGISALQDEI
jgi:hypothetical protein